MMSAANDPNRLSHEALDFAPDLLAMQERPPAKLPGVILYAVIALFAVLLAWAYFAKLDVVATAEGKLIPKSYLKIVQPSEGGILKEIRVNEGDKVQAGQVLMRMDAVLGEADTQILDSEMQQRQLQLRRIDAGLADRPLAMTAKDDVNLFRQIQAQHAARKVEQALAIFRQPVGAPVFLKQRASNAVFQAAHLHGNSRSVICRAGLINNGQGTQLRPNFTFSAGGPAQR